MLEKPLTCSTCGLSFDEIPFEDCPEHEAYKARERAFELDDDLWMELMEEHLAEILQKQE